MNPPSLDNTAAVDVMRQRPVPLPLAQKEEAGPARRTGSLALAVMGQVRAENSPAVFSAGAGPGTRTYLYLTPVGRQICQDAQAIRALHMLEPIRSKAALRDSLDRAWAELAQSPRALLLVGGCHWTAWSVATAEAVVALCQKHGIRDVFVEYDEAGWQYLAQGWKKMADGGVSWDDPQSRKRAWENIQKIANPRDRNTLTLAFEYDVLARSGLNIHRIDSAADRSMAGRDYVMARNMKHLMGSGVDRAVLCVGFQHIPRLNHAMSSVVPTASRIYIDEAYNNQPGALLAASYGVQLVGAKLQATGFQLSGGRFPVDAQPGFTRAGP